MSTGATKLERFQMPRVGDTLEGRYEISAILATGGMGVILRAKHVRMGRDVAIKVLHPHIAQEESVRVRFEREVRLAQLLNHPNTIRLYDYGEAENGLVYVVMELLEGRDLKEELAETGPMPVGRAVDLTLQVLDGLGEAHEQDFVHRDLKPSNLFLTSSRRGEDLVKILDFGIAKSLEDTASDVTATGSICGTAAYVAPEYLHNASAHKPADIYAVGLILLEMLTGQRVIQGSSTAQTLIMQMQHQVQVPAALAATPLGQIIVTATQKDPRLRYPDADAMYQALAAVADSLPADMRLDAAQVAPMTRAPSGSLPSMPFADSSNALPQAQHTPPTGEHGSAGLAAQFDGLENEKTLVTPLPSPLDAGAVPVPAPPKAAAPKSKGRGKTILAGVVLVALMGGAAAYFATQSSTSKPPADQPQQAASPEPAAKPAPDDKSEPAAKTAQEPTPTAPKQAAADKPAPDSKPAPAPTPAPVEFDFASSPSGASVYAGDKLLGHTPFAKSFAHDAVPEHVRVEKDGFEAATLDLSPTSETTQHVTLVAKPKPAASAKKHAPKHSAPTHHQAAHHKSTSHSSDGASHHKKGTKKGENVDKFLDKYL